jgi:hypothetical protein
LFWEAFSKLSKSGEHQTKGFEVHLPNRYDEETATFLKELSQNWKNIFPTH